MRPRVTSFEQIHQEELQKKAKSAQSHPSKKKPAVVVDPSRNDWGLIQEQEEIDFD